MDNNISHVILPISKQSRSCLAIQAVLLYKQNKNVNCNYIKTRDCPCAFLCLCACMCVIARVHERIHVCVPVWILWSTINTQLLHHTNKSAILARLCDSGFKLIILEMYINNYNRHLVSVKNVCTLHNTCLKKRKLMYSLLCTLKYTNTLIISEKLHSIIIYIF